MPSRAMMTTLFLSAMPMCLAIASCSCPTVASAAMASCIMAASVSSSGSSVSLCQCENLHSDEDWGPDTRYQNSWVSVVISASGPGSSPFLSNSWKKSSSRFPSLYLRRYFRTWCFSSDIVRPFGRPIKKTGAPKTSDGASSGRSRICTSESLSRFCPHRGTILCRDGG
ncbi:uncharacterized protein B0T15DRAFT_43706 [Chaetomium strumarium]|uniref:Secreted protein n=1 Tax=Chaetomium strumarium TaxID=1170767 RepID=A0AAJ0H2H3_9PEZI|nr:hypothetical protein B0T15DRAFT_43706 [Chaetomium strumarium]